MQPHAQCTYHPGKAPILFDSMNAPTFPLRGADTSPSLPLPRLQTTYLHDVTICGSNTKNIHRGFHISLDNDTHTTPGNSGEVNSLNGSGFSRRASLESNSMTDASPSDDQEGISEPDTPLSSDGDLFNHRFVSRYTSFGESAISGQMWDTIQEEGVIRGHTAVEEISIGDTVLYFEQYIEDEGQDESTSTGQSISPQPPWVINELFEGKQSRTAVIIPQESRSSCEGNDRGSKAKVGILQRAQQGVTVRRPWHRYFEMSKGKYNKSRSELLKLAYIPGTAVRSSWDRYFEMGKGEDHTRLRWISSPKRDHSNLKSGDKVSDRDSDLKCDTDSALKRDTESALKRATDSALKRDNNNPFLHVHPGVPFQQIVPERPPMFPYPPKVQYLSNNGSSVIMVATSSISSQESQRPLDLLEEEEARKREVIHRQFHNRLKVKNGHDRIRRRSNVVLPDPAYRGGSEPRVVARFRRVYAKPTAEGDSELGGSIHCGEWTVASTMLGVSNLPLTLSAMRLERYRQLCPGACHPSMHKTPSTLSDSIQVKINTCFPRTREEKQEPALVPSPLPDSMTRRIVLISRRSGLSISACGVSPQSSSSSLADRGSYSPSEIKQRVRRDSQHTTDGGADLGSVLHEISRSRRDSISQQSIGTYSSATTVLSARWQRPLWYKRSRSRRYPQSLQTNIRTRDELSHILEEPVVVLDVNDTTELRAAGIDPEEAHPNPEAFYERQFTHFHAHGFFLQDDLVQPGRGQIEVGAETIVLPKSEPGELNLGSRSANCPTTEQESKLAPSPLRRVASVTGRCWLRSKASVTGLIRRTKKKCLSAPLVGPTKHDKVVNTEEEIMAKKIREIHFVQAAMNGRRTARQDELVEEMGEWIQRIPAGHGSIGQFECRWLDAMA